MHVTTHDAQVLTLWPTHVQKLVHTDGYYARMGVFAASKG